MERKALVLFSGGQDSATCLAYALNKYEYVETIGFDYGQRHSVELSVRSQFISRLRNEFPDMGAKLGQDHLLNINMFGKISNSALTTTREISTQEGELPNTFVPGRNLLFFTLAAAVAVQNSLNVLVGGMCETDFSGYPDCRDDTLKSLQVTLNLGMNSRLEIETPLMWLDKAETWKMARALGGDKLLEMMLEHTHTCYKGDRSKRNDWGYGCGDCPACNLRENGFRKLNLQTPLNLNDKEHMNIESLVA